MAIKYRATKSLGYKRRHIRKGERVPLDYPRLKEGLRRGWVEEVNIPEVIPTIDEPAAPAFLEPDVEAVVASPEPEVIPDSINPEPDIETEPVPEPETESFPKAYTEPKPDNYPKDHGPEIPVNKFLKADEDKIADAKEILLDDLNFLKPDNVSVLLEAGLLEVADLEGWSFEQLVALKGIGKAKANQLLDAYDEYSKAE